MEAFPLQIGIFFKLSSAYLFASIIHVWMSLSPCYFCPTISVGSGSSGWQAPEQLRHERQTRAVDIFSLGCVLFFCITGGKHPYGDSFERDVNIVNNQKDLFLIENIPEAADLISALLHPNPELR